MSAAEEFTAGGRRYRFDSWSDGGARLHDITVPASASTLTATYTDVGPAPAAGLAAAYAFEEGSGTTTADVVRQGQRRHAVGPHVGGGRPLRQGADASTGWTTG